MYGLRSELVCLIAQLLKLVCLSKPEDTNLLQNLFIFCKLRVRNVL